MVRNGAEDNSPVSNGDGVAKTRYDWERWSQDERVHFARSDSGIRVRVPGHDGWPRESDWSPLADNVDATVRRLLNEMGYRSDPG
jgi:hypothetical protein